MWPQTPHILIALLICSLAHTLTGTLRRSALLSSLLMKANHHSSSLGPHVSYWRFQNTAAISKLFFEGDSSLDKGLGIPKYWPFCLSACHIMFKHNSNVTDGSSRQTDGVALCASLESCILGSALSVSLPAHHHARPRTGCEQRHERRGPPPPQSSWEQNRGFFTLQP